MKDAVEIVAKGIREGDGRRETPNEIAWSLDLATAALRALEEAGYVLTKVSVVTDPRDFLSTPPEGLRTIGDKPFGRA